MVKYELIGGSYMSNQTSTCDLCGNTINRAKVWGNYIDNDKNSCELFE